MDLLVFDLSIERTNEGCFAIVSVINDDKILTEYRRQQITLDEAGYILGLKNDSPEVEDIILDIVAGSV